MAVIWRHTCTDCGHPVVYRSARKGFVHIKAKGDCPLVVENVTATKVGER